MSGKCRTLQALEKSVLHDLLVDHYETRDSKAIKFKRADERRQARHRRLLRSKGLLLTYVTAKGKEISGDLEVEDEVAEQLVLPMRRTRTDLMTRLQAKSHKTRRVPTPVRLCHQRMKTNLISI